VDAMPASLCKALLNFMKANNLKQIDDPSMIPADIMKWELVDMSALSLPPKDVTPSDTAVTITALDLNDEAVKVLT
jgi:hypothetical protein